MKFLVIDPKAKSVTSESKKWTADKVLEHVSDLVGAKPDELSRIKITPVDIIYFNKTERPVPFWVWVPTGEVIGGKAVLLGVEGEDFTDPHVTERFVEVNIGW